MSDLYLDPLTDDLALTNFDLSITDGSLATMQRVKQALKAFAGEWFLDLSDGIPYYQDIFVKNPNPQVVDSLLRDAVLSVPGVLELTAFDLTPDPLTRKVSLDLGVRTSEDVIDFTLILGG